MPARAIPDKFLVAFSFAGEQQDLVRRIAEAVEKELGSGTVFFDEWFEYYLAGADADLKLQEIYGRKCELVVVCVSERYGGKPWTLAEHEAVRARLMQSRVAADERQRESVLPIRVGNGDVEGILFNMIVPDVRTRTPVQAAELIIERLRFVLPGLRTASVGLLSQASKETTGSAGHAVATTIPAAPQFDVFLSHNSKDKPAVRNLKQQLEAQALRVWYDEDQLRPGIEWQELLEEGIRYSASVAILVCKDGLGPWQDEEMKAALVLAVKDKRPVIPVLLPGSPGQLKLPRSLGKRTWVDFSGGLTDAGLRKLAWGITGQKEEAAPGKPRVYISYTWRAKNGQQRAFKLAENLRLAGIDSRVDLYYARSQYGFTPPDPQPGKDSWTVWQEEQIRDADRVILICSPEYANSPGDSGVARDLTFMELNSKLPGVELRKFIPVGFGPFSVNKPHVPSFIQGATYYNLSPGAKEGFRLEDLIRRFRGEFPGKAKSGGGKS